MNAPTREETTMIDVVMLAKEVTTLLVPLVPYLAKAGEKAMETVAQEIGREGWDKAKNLWQRLWQGREEKEAVREAVQEVINQPGDEDAAAALRLQVKKALAEDNSLAGEIKELLEEFRRVSPGYFQAWLAGSGAIAQGAGALAAGQRGVAIGGDAASVQTGDGNIAAGGHVVYAGQGATVVIGEAPVTMTAVDRESCLGRYLRHVISQNRYLQLQGIRSGGKLVHIELDRIYIRLRATRERVVEAEEKWLAREAELAPGEMGRSRQPTQATTETVTVVVEEALADYPRLVVLGDPGSGKTTLLRYLALLYARDLAEGSTLVRDKLGLAESGRLPILLPLRQIGAFLAAHHPADDGTEGHAVLLDFLTRSLQSERIELPGDFFDKRLEEGKAFILLDGLDEVADPDLRRRVSRLAESFTRAYPSCRYVVTSRIVGYGGAARLAEDYRITTVRDFAMADVEQFLKNWHRLIAIGQMGPCESAERHAERQTSQLLQAVKANERIRELAINPLMLTVIAMVHRDRVKLPDRRAELYAEAVDVLLGKWEEAKGVLEVAILPGAPFDTGDRRLMLQSLALHLHENKQKEIDSADLQQFLERKFCENCPVLEDQREVERAASRFVAVIEERCGLLVARGEGVYAFSHLTFQEYLTALAVGSRDDYVLYTSNRAADPWWREVILLEAGYLSIQGRERTTRLIRAIADLKEEPVPYHNLVLAAECLRDVGSSRVQGDLEGEIQRRLRQELETPPPFFSRWFKKWGVGIWIERRASAMEALVRAGAGYWSPPYGEPEWVDIPAGEFWMGSDAGSDNEKPLHQLQLAAFRIARAPITNAQYYLFVQHSGHAVPPGWEDNRPPKGQESHPVVNVSWHDAMAYCRWLSQVTGKDITLPSEAEWEKAARGERDRREYPWGDTFDATKCNCFVLGLGNTTPVGIFPAGASPYGCLDMAGNVWEWTRSLYKAYPYNADDGREKLNASSSEGRVLRGGSFINHVQLVRCADRVRIYPVFRNRDIGFRVVASPFPSGL
ncbi:MAG: SUMF1/EgtB/PvdO family nonheme iron enzyme [Thermodesulfobacteriota bacterium]